MCSIYVCVCVCVCVCVQDPPYFNVKPGGEYRQEAGRELVIPCAASGDPEIPTISWRKVRPAAALHTHTSAPVHTQVSSALPGHTHTHTHTHTHLRPSTHT